MKIPLSQEYVDMPDEDRRCLTEVIDQFYRGQLSSSVQVSSSGLTTHDLQLRKVISFVRTPIRVFLDSMESPLSQEYIDMPEEDRRCLTEVIDQFYRGQLSSSVKVSSSRLTTHDLQLRKVISPSSELRFRCSWTLWKSH